MAFLLLPAAAYGGGALAFDLALGVATAAGAISFMSSPGEPNHAPGASTADVERERLARVRAEEAARAARAATEQAEARGQQAGQALHLERSRANEAQRRLREIEEENRKKEEDKANYPVPTFLQSALKSGKVNLAVTGNSGVGKSSFINFIRKVKKKDPYYAKVGSSECTTEPAGFQSASGDTVWDLPGAGTPKFPQDIYMKTMGIRYFDIVFLLTAERFTEAELMLKKELEKFKVPFFCVRNKADLAWDSKITEEKESLEENEDEDTSVEISSERKQELKNEAIQELRTHFEKEHGISSLYLISTKNEFRNEFDFEKLQKDTDTAVENARLVQTCPICFELYEEFGGPRECQRHAAQCGHTWCKQCQGHPSGSCSSTCPLCRRNEDAAQTLAAIQAREIL